MKEIDKNTEAKDKSPFFSVGELKPRVDPTVFVAPTASVVGDVEIGGNSSIWFSVTLRGDVFPIKIGKECNVQDNSVLHGTYKKCGVVLEDRVSIAHGVILHGCHIGSGSLVGMGSIVMDNVKIGKNCVVGAGSLVVENTEVPDNWLVLGRPAKPIREIKPSEMEWIKKTSDHYLMYKTWYEGEEKQ